MGRHEHPLRHLPARAGLTIDGFPTGRCMDAMPHNRGPKSRGPGKSRREAKVTVADFISPPTFWFPDYFCQSAWIEHAPFAFWLIEAHRPRMLVELGTHWGFSFFAFCQAVQHLGCGTSCFAVDTWKGDEHAGFYAENVFESVGDHLADHYSAFARLVRSTFGEALAHFENGSIDLLHIDGRHFYDDVRQDFESWLPKLSDRAIVIFHDINVRERGFGVFRLWSELQKEYPNFAFLHGHGLGVAVIGEHAEDRVLALCGASANSELSGQIRQAYARLGGDLSERQARQVERDRVVTANAELASQNVEVERLRKREVEADTLAGQLTAACSRVAELEQAAKDQASEVERLQQRLAELGRTVDTGSDA
jgi:Methyltransferase domain